MEVVSVPSFEAVGLGLNPGSGNQHAAHLAAHSPFWNGQ